MSAILPSLGIRCLIGSTSLPLISSLLSVHTPFPTALSLDEAACCTLACDHFCLVCAADVPGAELNSLGQGAAVGNACFGYPPWFQVLDDDTPS